MTTRIDINNGVANVLMNFPPHNLLSNSVKQEITNVFRELSRDENVRVIVFGAAGDNFCLGADLKEFPDRFERGNSGDVWSNGHEMIASILDCPQPTISWMKGKAFGGGAELISAFDFRILEEDAQLAYPETLRGVFPGNGGLERLVDLVGLGKAMELIILGEPISAQTALQIGLASTVVETPCDYAVAIAGQLTERSNVTLRLAKEAIRMYHKNKEDFVRSGMNLFVAAHQTDDVREAVSAFMTRRSPKFRHR